MSMSSDPRRRRTQNPSATRRASGSGQAQRNPSGARRPSQQSAGRGRPTQSRRRRKKRISPMKIVGQWIAAIVAALIIAFIVRSFLVDVVTVAGHSMDGTIASGDTAVVTKFSYWIGNPARGDIICFNLPSGEGRTIKRVVGLPGETVEIVDGVTYIDGEELYEGYVSIPDTDTYMPMTIPANYYLVLSDNRPEGGDSRYGEVGLVSYTQLSGKVAFVLWPLSHIGGVR